MSSFDPEAFLVQTVNDSFSTRFAIVPEGNYTSVIEKVAVREIQGGDSVILDVSHNLMEEQLKADLDMEKIIVHQSIFLDFNDAGSLEIGEGKNVRLGRLREAVGQNVPGKPWNLRMLEGAGPLLISVIQRADKNDPSTIYNDVSRTGSLAA